MSRGRYCISVTFLLSGAVIFTYAATRTWTTRLVLTRASGHVMEYLETKNFYYGVNNVDVQIDEDTQVESKRLLGGVGSQKGQYTLRHRQ